MIRYEQATMVQINAKQRSEEMERLIESSIKCPRSKALAFTKLEECYAWIGKGIRNDQIARNGNAELQEERTNS
jgi:hypothetical protein